MEFVHSGNFGDIIYSIPFCKAYAELKNCSKFKMNLKINVAAQYAQGHPLHNVRMDRKTALMITPLLKTQSYIEDVEIVECTPQRFGVYDLDSFRDHDLQNLGAGSISHWYYPMCTTLMKMPNLNESWIENIGKTDIGKGKDIVMFRSSRYRRNNLDYSVLRKYRDRIVFIGLPQEHMDFKIKFFDVDMLEIRDFEHAAKIMNSAKLVIGNQTGFFSIAEAMKKRRLLETAYECPNVIMSGGEFQYVIHTAQLQKLIHTFIGEN